MSKSGPLGPWVPQRAKRITITPEQAGEILEQYNNMNRRPVHSTIKRISDDLTHGRWEFNGETIIFADDGTLLDGQNRLIACRDTGVDIETNVSFGHDRKVFPTLDKGKSRNLATDLEIAGEKNPMSLAAALVVITHYLNNVRSTALVSGSLNYDDAKQTLDHYPRIRESVHYTNTIYQKCFLPPRLIAAVHYLICRESPTLKLIDGRTAFFDGLASGANLADKNPILALRNKLISMSNLQDPQRGIKKGGHAGNFFSLHCLVRAWNSYAQGRELSVFGGILKSHKLQNQAIFNDLPEIVVEWSPRANSKWGIVVQRMASVQLNLPASLEV